MSTVFIDDGFPFLYCRHASCPAAILRRAPTSFLPSFLRTAAAAAAGLPTARPHLCLSSSDQLASSTTLPLHYSYYRAAASMMLSIYPPSALKLETSVGLGMYHQACV
jgi:hypothetical protein